MGKWFLTAWQALRRITNDDAYDRYLTHHRTHHPSTDALTRQAFFTQEQQRKWEGVKRCC